MVTAVISSVLAALLVLTAVRKLSHRPSVVASYRRVGVPENRLNALAALLLAAAAGLVVGIWWTAVGVATALGLVCYFVVAVAAHIRFDDRTNLPTPLVFLAFAIGALVTQVA